MLVSLKQPLVSKQVQTVQSWTNKSLGTPVNMTTLPDWQTVDPSDGLGPWHGYVLNVQAGDVLIGRLWVTASTDHDHSPLLLPRHIDAVPSSGRRQKDGFLCKQILEDGTAYILQDCSHGTNVALRWLRPSLSLSAVDVRSSQEAALGVGIVNVAQPYQLTVIDYLVWGGLPETYDKTLTVQTGDLLVRQTHENNIGGTASFTFYGDYTANFGWFVVTEGGTMLRDGGGTFGFATGAVNAPWWGHMRPLPVVATTSFHAQ